MRKVMKRRETYKDEEEKVKSGGERKMGVKETGRLEMSNKS